MAILVGILLLAGPSIVQLTISRDAIAPFESVIILPATTTSRKELHYSIIVWKMETRTDIASQLAALQSVLIKVSSTQLQKKEVMEMNIVDSGRIEIHSSLRETRRVKVESRITPNSAAFLITCNLPRESFAQCS